MNFNWNPPPQMPERSVELVLASDDYEHLIISDYIRTENEDEVAKVYMFVAKFKKMFEEVETIHEIQFNKLFFSLAECQGFAEEFLESKSDIYKY